MRKGILFSTICLGIALASTAGALGIGLAEFLTRPEPQESVAQLAWSVDRSDLPVFTTSNAVGITTFTASSTLTLPTLTATAVGSSHNNALITVAVEPDRVADLLQAIAGRGTVIAVRQPDNYCRPQRDVPAVAQPAPAIVAARD